MYSSPSRYSNSSSANLSRGQADLVVVVFGGGFPLLLDAVESVEAGREESLAQATKKNVAPPQRLLRGEGGHLQRNEQTFLYVRQAGARLEVPENLEVLDRHCVAVVVVRHRFGGDLEALAL